MLESGPNFGLDPTHELTVKGLTYWRSKCRGNDPPRHGDIDPLEMLDLVTHVNLVDVVHADDGTMRLRHRLEGTALTERFKRNSTGAWFDENYEPEHLARVMPFYVDAIENRRPSCAPISLSIGGIEVLRYERLICPLIDDAGTVTMLFLVFGFFPITAENRIPEDGRMPLHKASSDRL